MRYIDIAVAALVGTSAITGIVAWTPRSGDSAAEHMLLQSRLRDGLLAYLQQRGMVWLLQSSPEEVCADLANRSNSSITLSATMGSLSCNAPPADVSTIATLTFRLPSYEVTLEAWSNGKA